MAESIVPILSGGVFFAIILTAHKVRTGKKEQRYGSKDAFSEKETLIGLIKVVHPEYEPKSDNKTQGTHTTDFKSGTGDSFNVLYFEHEVTAFDKCVKTDYQTAFDRMAKFVDSYVAAGSSVKHETRLTKELLAFIEKDASILDTDVFYIHPDGRKTTKAELRTVADFNISSFLLGVWHFIVVNRKDNTSQENRTMLAALCPSNNRNPRVYKGNFHEGITRPIKVDIATIVDNGFATELDESAFECNNAHQDEPYVKVDIDEPPPLNTTTQIQYNGTPITVIAQPGGVGIGVNTAPITINNK